jgi:hypothetical protein
MIKKLSPLIFLNIVASISVIAIAMKIFLAPLVGELLHKEEYKDLVFQCDYSMREHMIAKNRFLIEPSKKTDDLLRAAEVGLISCHDYDLLRKRLGVFGISEAKLAEFGLEAIEKNSKDVKKIVEIHEFRY